MSWWGVFLTIITISGLVLLSLWDTYFYDLFAPRYRPRMTPIAAIIIIVIMLIILLPYAYVNNFNIMAWLVTRPLQVYLVNNGWLIYPSTVEGLKDTVTFACDHGWHLDQTRRGWQINAQKELGVYWVIWHCFTFFKILRIVYEQILLFYFTIYGAYFTVIYKQRTNTQLETYFIYLWQVIFLIMFLFFVSDLCDTFLGVPLISLNYFRINDLSVEYIWK